jgi:deoxyribodipyrimidine photo-lyase
MRTLVLFTRDLRVHDHPALADAARRGGVLPLCVLDETLLARSPNRARWYLSSLADLGGSLARLGAPLAVARGDAADVAISVARRFDCDAIHLTRDVSTFARRRADRLRATAGPAGVAFREFPGHAVVEPGAVRPAGRSAYRVFTPYLRAWADAPRRATLAAPRRLRAVPGVLDDPALAPPPSPSSVAPTAVALPEAGETAGRRRLARFLRSSVAGYGQDRDRLDRDATSRLSPYLRFGCVSVAEVEARAATPGTDPFVRQLAWRDFFLQLLAAEPRLAWASLRPPPAPFRDAHEAAEDLEAWARGETGQPLVDAAMRRLERDGWIPNRARLVAAGYLTKTLRIDWRPGAAHFDRHLVDGDPASNAGNWQWVAGTAANPRPNRPFNADRQAARYDPDGRYAGARPSSASSSRSMNGT